MSPWLYPDRPYLRDTWARGRGMRLAERKAGQEKRHGSALSVSSLSRVPGVCMIGTRHEKIKEAAAFFCGAGY